MRRAVAEVEARFGSINGVIHVAGLADYEGVIQGRTRQGTDNILASKLKGTMILDDLLKDRSLDFFILQVGYAAANAFLDAFALHKYHNHISSARSQHPCLYAAINWDAWQEVGMAVEAVGRAGGDAGVLLKDGILPEEGVDVFERILASGLPQVVVSTQDLAMLLEQWHAPGLAGEFDEAGGSAYLDERPGLRTAYIAPENETQQVLARIWQDFFGLKAVGIHDDFFELGGDSLKAMTVSAKIHKALHVEVPLAEFFRVPTVAGLAGYIRKTETGGYFSMEPVEEREYYDLSYAQRRLWIICQFEEESLAYNLAHVFALAGEFNVQVFQWAVQTLVDRHESLRTVFIQVDQEPKQKILNEGFVNVDVIDLRRSDPDGKKEKMKEIYAEVAGGAFDLEQGPLFRLQVIRPGDNQWVVPGDYHK
jgi:acyl carrier protein